mmetsp:Transcript_133058/g.332111  ORF Transcript_133058/g.332111 Transcript_133058/m.332111 type:complete len:203 (+) Transcript_133058:1888-2496(+)
MVPSHFVVSFVEDLSLTLRTFKPCCVTTCHERIGESELSAGPASSTEVPSGVVLCAKVSFPQVVSPGYLKFEINVPAGWIMRKRIVPTRSPSLELRSACCHPPATGCKTPKAVWPCGSGTPNRRLLSSILVMKHSDRSLPKSQEPTSSASSWPAVAVADCCKRYTAFLSPVPQYRVGLISSSPPQTAPHEPSKTCCCLGSSA